MILQPLGTRVLLKRKSIRSYGSILVPNTSRQAVINLGEVVAIGDECEALKVGDICLFGQYAPLKIDMRDMEFSGIQFDKDEYTDICLMNEEDALCLIQKEKEPKSRDQIAAEIIQGGFTGKERKTVAN